MIILLKEPFSILNLILVREHLTLDIPIPEKMVRFLLPAQMIYLFPGNPERE
jgi:hypothetical protein